MTDPPPVAALRRTSGSAHRARIAAALWTLGIAALLWAPSRGGPSRWPFAEQLEAFAQAGGDKLVHGALFAVHAFLLGRCRRGGAGWLAASFALATGYGALTEAGQLWVEGRDAVLADAVANTVGAGLGIALHGRPSGSR